MIMFDDETIRKAVQQNWHWCIYSYWLRESGLLD